MVDGGGKRRVKKKAGDVGDGDSPAEDEAGVLLRKVEGELHKGDEEVPRLLGEELDIIHVECMAHMRNIAYSDAGANLFECPICHRKAIVMEYKGEGP